MITSYFTDPLEKQTAATEQTENTPRMRWRKHSWWKHSVVLSVIQCYTEKLWMAFGWNTWWNRTKVSRNSAAILDWIQLVGLKHAAYQWEDTSHFHFSDHWDIKRARLHSEADSCQKGPQVKTLPRQSSKATHCGAPLWWGSRQK